MKISSDHQTIVQDQNTKHEQDQESKSATGTEPQNDSEPQSNIHDIIKNSTHYSTVKLSEQTSEDLVFAFMDTFEADMQANSLYAIELDKLTSTHVFDGVKDLKILINESECEETQKKMLNQ